MTRRGRRGSVESLLNLDSLVDVVTNLNGMLLLFAVFTTLISMGKTYRVRSPLVQNTEKAAVFFECHYNRVFPVEENGRYSDNYYLTPLGSSTMLTLKDKNQGTPLAQLNDPNADFWKAARAIDPATQYAAFLVRPDSFEVFRAAREMLGRNRIEVGWEPWEQPIIFGSGGRRVKTQ